MSAGLEYRPGRYTLDDRVGAERRTGPRLELLDGDIIVDEAPSLARQDTAFGLAIVCEQPWVCPTGGT